MREAIGSRRPDVVLSAAAPDIDYSEADLPKVARTTLAQLQSGYCSALNDFRHRIDLSPSPACPCCRQADHTTDHLFNCSEHPTDLTPWTCGINPWKLWSSSRPGRASTVFTGRGPHLSLPQPHSERGRAMKTKKNESRQLVEGGMVKIGVKK